MENKSILEKIKTLEKKKKEYNNKIYKKIIELKNSCNHRFEKIEVELNNYGNDVYTSYYCPLCDTSLTKENYKKGNYNLSPYLKINI